MNKIVQKSVAATAIVAVTIWALMHLCSSPLVCAASRASQAHIIAIILIPCLSPFQGAHFPKSRQREKVMIGLSQKRSRYQWKRAHNTDGWNFRCPGVAPRADVAISEKFEVVITIAQASRCSLLALRETHFHHFGP
jgi:hypothetical protein